MLVLSCIKHTYKTLESYILYTSNPPHLILLIMRYNTLLPFPCPLPIHIHIPNLIKAEPKKTPCHAHPHNNPSEL